MAQYNRDMISREENSGSSVLSGLVKTAAGLTALSLAAAGSWILYSNLAIDRNLPLPEAVEAERKTFQSPLAGWLSYYVDRSGEGRPLVLIHSINAAASAYEMRPLFKAYQSKRPVFALDLPGFGFSERTEREYSPRLFVNAILDFMASQVGEAADVVALSLSSEFVAQAALTEPQWFHSLAFISPTGLGTKEKKDGAQGSAAKGKSQMLHNLFSVPLWARPLYDLLTTRPSIQAFLKQNFVGTVEQDLINYDYASAHQPGAEHAPLHFISGMLFTPGIAFSAYEKLNVPTLVIYDRDPYTNFNLLPKLLARNPNWQAVRIVPSLGLPQFERTQDTVQTFNQFWQGIKED